MNIFLIFFNMKICCVFSLELPHRGDSNVFTEYTIFQYETENHPELSQICNYGIFPMRLKKLKTAVETSRQCSSH